MSFWSSVGTSLATSLGKGLGGAAAGYGAQATLGRIAQAQGESRGQARKNFHTDMKAQQVWTEKNARLGRDLDVEAQQEMFDFRLDRAREAGLTNVEAFGSPAAGGGGGTGAGTTTLGNAAATSGAQMRQAATQQKIAASENEKDRMASLAQTAMQTTAQKDVAEINAGVQTRGQDLNAFIESQKLDLGRDNYHLNVKTAGQTIRESEQRVQKLIHETATSDPKFVTAMKQLSMGPANMLVELTMRHHGISLHDDTFINMPSQKREAILAELLALSSKYYTETSGLKSLFTQGVKAHTEGASAAEQLLKDVWNAITGSEDDEKPATDGPTLGSRMSEPSAHAPNMNYR